METGRLRHFAVYSRTGTVAGAAAELNVSPSLVSKSISGLSRVLDVELVHKSGRRIVPTDAGREVARRAREILQLVDDLEHTSRLDRLAHASTPVRIVTFGPLATGLIGRVAAHPSAGPLTVLQAAPGALEELVARDGADLGLTLLPTDVNGVEHEVIGRLEYGAFARVDVAAGREACDPELEWVVPAVALPHGLAGQSGDGWPDHRYPRRIRHRVTLFETMLQMAAEGAAVAFLPSRVVDVFNHSRTPHSRLRALALPPDLQVALPVSAVRRMSALVSSDARAVEAVCAALLD